MAKPLIDDELWANSGPLIPTKPRRIRCPGRKRLDNRRALIGIVFALKNRHRLERPAAGNGLWQWHDLLATVT